MNRTNFVSSIRTSRVFFCGALLTLLSVVCQPVLGVGLHAPAGAVAAAGGSSGGAPSPNLPRNALTMDQSAYAMGSMTWNVVFLESDGTVDTSTENWTAGELANVQNEISQAKSYWEGLTSGFHAGAQLSIDIHYANGATPLATGYEPITRTTGQESLWINDAMNALGYNSGSHFTNVRNYNQARRVADNNHWATTIFIVDDTVDPDNQFNGGGFAYAYFGGPFTVLTQGNNGWGNSNFNMVLAHEMGHIFNALDEYQASNVRTTHRGGYLNGLTLNASLDGAGNPIAPLQPNALMLNNGNFGTGVPYQPHSSASVNFGHRDTDADTIPDILDTFPTLTGNDLASNPATGDFVFSGSVSVNDFANNNPLNINFSNSQNDMTINTIASMSYVLDAGLPVSFAALDGVYDDYTELLGFTIPGLAAGNHTIDVLGTNSVGNTSNLLQFSFVVGVPEPSSLMLAAFGLMGLIRSRRGAGCV